MKQCHDSRRLEEIFAALFRVSTNTCLVGGVGEPVYLPALCSDEQSITASTEHQNRLCYREDYFASALHEVAHWCIAGQARRRLKDFGYWYQADGRDSQSQQAFESVEVKPQALEFLFSVAAGYRFTVSVDNLANNNLPSSFFSAALLDQVDSYLGGQVPPRANLFLRALYREFDVCKSYDQYLALASTARDDLASALAKVANR